MEENFEKKSTKKVGIIISIIAVLIILAVAGGFWFLNLNRNPEETFAQKVEDMFENVETKKYNSGRIELEMSARIDADDPEIKAVNEYLEAIKLKSITEIDSDKEILNENLIALYNGKEIINASALIQDEEIYVFLKDIYSKYIKLNDYYVEEFDLSELFETSLETIDEDLINELKQAIIDEIKGKEYIKEDVEIDGKKAQKSTLKLNGKEATQILKKILEIVDSHEDVEYLSELIEELEYELEYVDDDEFVFEISLYTKGLKSELIKAELAMIDLDYEEAIGIEINKDSENEMSIKFLMNEEDAEISGATEIIEIAIKENDENSGEVAIKINVYDEGTVSFNIKYSVDYEADIKKANTSKSIELDSLTEEDFNEMLENIEENDILYGLLEIMGAFDTAEDYDYDYDYDYDDYYEENYLEDYIYDYNY